MKFFTLRSYFSEITELEVMNDQCHTSARRRTEIPLCLGPRCLSIPAADRLPRLFLVGKSIALPDPAPGRLRTPPSSVVSIGLSRFKATPLAALFAVFDCRDSNVFVFGARQYRLLLSRFPIMCPCDRTWTGRITPRGQAA